MKLVPNKFRHTVERRGNGFTIVIEDAPRFRSYEHEAHWWDANCGQMDRLTLRYGRSPETTIDRHGREQRIHTMRIGSAAHTKSRLYPPK